MYGFALFHLSPCNIRLPRSDTCRPALLMDALIIRRALFERSELARPPGGLRPSHVMRPGGASMVLATFAETKVARLPGRNPAIQKSTVIREFGKKKCLIKHDRVVRPEPCILVRPGKAGLMGKEGAIPL